MRAVSMVVAMALCATVVEAQQVHPLRPSLAQVAQAATQPAAEKTASAGGRGRLFWSGIAVGVAGVTTSVLGLTALRTDRTSTGNAPDDTYRACVALRDSNPIYASSQCGALKGKNLKLLWGGVALGGAGAALMFTGRNTSAQLAPGSIGLFHRWQF